MVRDLYPRDLNDYKLVYNLTGIIIGEAVALTLYLTAFPVNLFPDFAWYIIAIEAAVNTLLALLPLVFILGWSYAMAWDLYIRPLTRPQSELDEEGRFQEHMDEWMENQANARSQAIHELREEVEELKE